MDTTFYVDIKSLWLRDAMRIVLKDVRGISAKEDKLSVSYFRSLHKLAINLSLG